MHIQDKEGALIAPDVPDQGRPDLGQYRTARRAFLRWVTALSALGSGALVGFPALRALFWPAFKPAAAEKWTRLGEAAVFELDVPIKIDFTDTVKDGWVVSRVMRSVWLYTSDGERFTAYNARCTHLGCGYSYDAEARTFRCPCHEGRFDVQTGVRLMGPPPRPLDRLKVKVEDGNVYVAYQDFRLGVAEAIPV
jgi:menaquinol-cytochrome c reductase iron-sulfur subunit